MHVYHQLEEVGPALGAKATPSAVAIGNFDGCHRGHVALVQKTLAYARPAKLVPTVLTFFPHPVEVLNPSKPLKRLTTTSEKLVQLEKLGIERIFVVPFDKALSQMTAEDFFQKYLLDGLLTKSIHVGFNFNFGKDRQGNTELLKKLCDQKKVHLEIMPPYEEDGVRVSSSAIRDLIRAGDLPQASHILGRNYAFTGQVSRGDARGRGLGFPTANLQIPQEKVLPPNGVYVTRALWQQEWFHSVTNIGIRPTFDAPAPPRPVIEVHFLDFHAKIYDETVKLELLEKIRDERKFASVEELKQQIQSDIAYTRNYFSRKT